MSNDHWRLLRGRERTRCSESLVPAGLGTVAGDALPFEDEAQGTASTREAHVAAWVTPGLKSPPPLAPWPLVLCHCPHGTLGVHAGSPLGPKDAAAGQGSVQESRIGLFSLVYKNPLTPYNLRCHFRKVKHRLLVGKALKRNHRTEPLPGKSEAREGSHGHTMKRSCFVRS